MPKPVYLLTVQEAYKEYNSLTDQIWAKYEQLDSGEFGEVGTPAFKAEACELANLLACVNQQTEPATSKGTLHVHILQALKMLCSHRYVRITGLLSTSLILRIGDWLCILPAITLLVDKSQKAASSD